jgi:hypothetical protein
MSEVPKRAWLQKRLESRAQKLVAIAAGITTLIGLPLAVKALVDAFWPEDVPRSAALTVGPYEQVDRTWGDFLREYPGEFRDEGYTKQQLDAPGLVLPVHVKASGLVGKTWTLTWHVRDPNGSIGNYDPPSWVPLERDIRSSTSPLDFVAHVWLPPPPDTLDEEIVHFIIKDDRGTELGQADSETIQAEPTS